MADVFSKAKRSEVMSKIRSRGTTPELRLAGLIEGIARGRKCTMHVSRLPGTPDIVVNSLKTAVFVHGCFFHKCPKHGHNPKTNRRYWIPKLEKNRRRYQRVRRRLNSLGYSVLTVWEHDLKSTRIESTTLRISKRFQRQRLQVD